TLSRPFLTEPPAFLCAIASVLLCLPCRRCPGGGLRRRRLLCRRRRLLCRRLRRGGLRCCRLRRGLGPSPGGIGLCRRRRLRRCLRVRLGRRLRLRAFVGLRRLGLVGSELRGEGRVLLRLTPSRFLEPLALGL